MVQWESPKSEILLGSLLNPGKIEVISLVSSRSPLSSVLGVETVGDVGVTLALGHEESNRVGLAVVWLL